MLHIKNVGKLTKNCISIVSSNYNIIRGKKVIDKSLVPKLREADLKEHFIKGSGPGGQKVNKSVNCVYLVHKPTGISVKVHEFRDQHQNRKKARQKVMFLLDDLINGEKSVKNQAKIIAEEKSKKRLQKQKKLNELKKDWKKSISDFCPTKN